MHIPVLKNVYATEIRNLSDYFLIIHIGHLHQHAFSNYLKSNQKDNNYSHNRLILSIAVILSCSIAAVKSLIVLALNAANISLLLTVRRIYSIA